MDDKFDVFYYTWRSILERQVLFDNCIWVEASQLGEVVEVRIIVVGDVLVGTNALEEVVAAVAVTKKEVSSLTWSK